VVDDVHPFQCRSTDSGSRTSPARIRHPVKDTKGSPSPFLNLLLQAVEHTHPCSRGQPFIRHMGSDETGPACNQNSFTHGCLVPHAASPGDAPRFADVVPVAVVPA
jgi:hypothetical protein